MPNLIQLLIGLQTSQLLKKWNPITSFKQIHPLYYTTSLNHIFIISILEVLLKKEQKIANLLKQVFTISLEQWQEKALIFSLALFTKKTQL